MSSAHSKSVENLIRMANDIAENLGHGAADDVVVAEQVANHIRRFWAPTMKVELKNSVSLKNHGLSQLAEKAVSLL